MEFFVCVRWHTVSKHCFPKDWTTPGFLGRGFWPAAQPRSGCRRLSGLSHWPTDRAQLHAYGNASAAGELHQFDGAEVTHPSTYTLGAVEQHIGLGSERIAQHRGIAVYDHISPLEVTKRDRETIG